MLLDDLLEPGVVQLSEFGQVMNIGNNVTEYLLKQQEIRIRGRGARSSNTLATGIGRAVQTGDDIVHLELAFLNSVDNLLALALLEKEHLLQLTLEQGDEMRLIVLGPFFAGGLGVIGGWLVDEICFESFLEIVVGNVVRIEFLDHGRTEIFTEPVTQLSQYIHGAGSGMAGR